MLSPSLTQAPPALRGAPVNARSLGVLALMMIASGCAYFQKADTRASTALIGDQLPDRWTARADFISPDAATSWLDDFSDHRLGQLVEEAVGGNYDLAASASRIRQAEARARIAGASRYPQFSGDLSVDRSQRLRGVRFEKTRATSYNLGLDFSWEIDLWGRLANRQDAALAEVAASDADYQAARLSLAANVTKTTLELWEARAQAELSRATRDSLLTNLEILDAKLEAGDADDRTALEISLSGADVARAEASIAQEGRIADEAARRLETLLGRYPRATVKGLDAIPQLRRSVPAGLPSDLLLRRPDLIAAERRIDAALSDVAASRKALLPSFRLNGGAGTNTTTTFRDLIDAQALVWNLGASLAQPLFEGGRLIAEIDLSEADRDVLVSEYAEIALQAFREVETALAAEAFFVSQEISLEKAVEEALRAEALSLSQYQKGLVDIITVLESQRRAFDTRSSLLTVQRQRAQNRVDLHLALGGDFENAPAVNAGNTPSSD